MRIGFLSLLNPFDVKYWSGTLFYLTKQLSNHQICWYGKGVLDQLYAYRPIKSAVFCLEQYADLLGEIMSEGLKRNDIDILIVRDSSLVAGIDVPFPIIFIGDTTFNGMKDYFGTNDENLCKMIDKVEKSCLKNTSLIMK